MKFKKLMAYVLSASIVLSAGSVSTNVSAAQDSSGKGHKVYLKAATLEPGKGSSKRMQALYRAFSNEERPYIVSFDGPITDEVKNSIMKLGVKFLDYTPDYSYLCYMTADIAETVKNLSHVVDVFTYENQYKIDPALMSKVMGNIGAKSVKSIDVSDLELEVRISTFGIDDTNLKSEIEDLGASNVYQSGNDFYAKISLDKVEELSTLKSVKFIEEVPEFRINNNKASGIVQSELVSTFGYEGRGQIVGVADSGLDKGISGFNNGTLHRDFFGRINKIIDRIGSSGADENGHGTHVESNISIPDIGTSYRSPMTTKRMDFGATASENGKIYIAGGKNGSNYLNTVEAYDPSNDTWEQNTPMSQNRSGFRMVEADNGKIYAIGGFDGNSYLNTVEEYNPANDSWTVKSSISTPRSDFGVACVDGKIYVIGGYNGTTLKSVEVYNPNTDTWTSANDMPTARSNFGTGVVNGKITVMGGVCDTDNLKTVEEFDPSSGNWTVKNNLSDWNSHFCVSESNGKLYIFGGKNSTQIIEYDTLTCSEVKRVELPSEVYGHATATQNGNIYILGGFVDSSYSDQNLCYMPQKDGWSQEPSLINEKAFFTAEIVDGKIYTIGGQNRSFSPVKTVEEYDISTGTWSLCPSMSEEKLHLASGVIDGKIYVCGGNYWKLYTSYSNVLEVYDPANRTWTKKANMPEGLSMHKAVSLDGYLYVVGGQKKLNDPDSSIELSQSVYKYDPISNSWSTVASLPIPRVNHGLVTLNGKIYVIGGNNSTGVLDSIYEYDPLTDNWAAKEPMPQGYMQFSTAVINDKIYIIGGSDYSIDLSSVYEYDPVNETWTEKHSLPSVMARNCSVFDGNKIYTMGGMLDLIIDIDVIDTMYSYSPSDENIIKLDMGSGLMEPKAGTKILPLSISNVPAKGIYEVDVTLEYDPSTLSVTTITSGSVIADSNAFSYNIDNTLGTINICYNGTQQAISNNGILANIEFDVLQSVTTTKTSPLSFVKGNSKVYGVNSYEYKGLKLIDGAVDIFIYGDVDGNGECNALDFAFMNKYLTGQIKNLPGAYSAISGDVDASGDINAIDFAIFRIYMLGKFFEDFYTGKISG